MTLDINMVKILYERMQKRKKNIMREERREGKGRKNRNEGRNKGEMNRNEERNKGRKKRREKKRNYMIVWEIF